MAGNIARNLQTTSSVMATFVAMFTEQFNVFYFTINIVQRYNVAITFVFDLGCDIFWAILSSEISVWLAITIFRCRSGRYSLHTAQVWFGIYIYYNGAAEPRAIGFGFGY